jgi:hypothetical protein
MKGGKQKVGGAMWSFVFRLENKMCILAQMDSGKGQVVAWPRLAKADGF